VVSSFFILLRNYFNPLNRIEIRDDSAISTEISFCTSCKEKYKQNERHFGSAQTSTLYCACLIDVFFFDDAHTDLDFILVLVIKE
jgi:hypothetical protein